MRTRFLTCAVAAAALTTLACGESAPTSPAMTDISPLFSRGQATQDLGRLAARGWTCVPIPMLGVHCFPPGAFASSPSISVLVFDTDDPNDADAAFLGTEILIRADLYAGQPCTAEGGEYALLPASETGFPADYRACHHYEVEHGG